MTKDRGTERDREREGERGREYLKIRTRDWDFEVCERGGSSVAFLLVECMYVRERFKQSTAGFKRGGRRRG